VSVRVTRCRCLALAGTAAVTLLGGTRARAQEAAGDVALTPLAATDPRALTEQPTVRCTGDTISEIVVRPRPPFVRGMLRRWQVVSRLVDDMHVTTRPEVVRRFLLLDAGDACTEFRRAESERILRAQPFLAAAVVRPEPDGPGRVRLVVETVDELTVVAGVGASTTSPNLRMLRAGEENVDGRGIAAAAEWRAGRFERDGYTVRAAHHQLLGRPYIAATELRRDELGGRWSANVSHPFYTDLQRIAWRVSGGQEHEFTYLRQPGADELVLGARRDFADVGGIVRVGPPGRLSLFGASLSHERARVDTTLRRFTPLGFVEVPDSMAVLGRYRAMRSSRLNALWGVRNVRYLPVVGFDALSAVQDVKEGFEAGALVGRSLALLGSRDDDVFVAADLYGGVGGPTSFVMLHARAEGRQDFDTDRWDDVIGSASLTWYHHAGARHTLIATGEYAGGWRVRAPFQLLLGMEDGGVRGYQDSPVGGAQRAVGRLESRWRIGAYGETAEYGLAGFADAGWLWAGDVPFGRTTGAKVGVGVGILASFPAGSQRLWRLDLAHPLMDDPRAGFEVRLGSTVATRFGWREPLDVRRSRQRTVPDGIFSWP
jgi:hypothetical protein